jgi:hypothetical protein
VTSSLKLKAKAIVAVRNRKKKEQATKDAIQARESALEQRLLSTLTQRIPAAPKAPEQPPTLSQIVSEVLPLIPESTHTENTVVQMVEHPTELTDESKASMEAFIRGVLPEIQEQDKPAVEQIIQETTIDVSDKKLEGFVSQEEFKKALRRIQDAITANQSGGGGGSGGDLVNVIQASVDTTVTQNQLLTNKYNVILVMTAGITITLPEDTGTKIIEIKQGFTGTGTYTVCKA